MMHLLRRQASIVGAGLKFLKVIGLILLFYLFQVAVMPHLTIFGIMPNLLMVIIAIMTVSYGKLYAFITGSIIGILLESMGMTIPLFYLLIYPVLALLFAQVFADMSDIKREMRRIREAQRQSDLGSQITAPFMRKKLRLRFRRQSAHDMNAHLRILLNSLVLTAAYEGIMLIYIALVGIPVTANHFLRLFNTLLYTALCCLTMFPVRAFLGLYKRRRRLRGLSTEQELVTGREVLKQLALVPDDAPQPKAKKKPILSMFRRGEKPTDSQEPSGEQEKTIGEQTKESSPAVQDPEEDAEA